MKYVIGQAVTVDMYGKNFDDDYKLPATIHGYDLVYLTSGTAVYAVKDQDGKILHGIAEARINKK